MSAEVPDIEGLIDMHGQLLAEAGVTEVYFAVLEDMRSKEAFFFALKGDDFSSYDRAYQKALAASNRVIVRPDHYGEISDDGMISAYFLTQIGPDGVELHGADYPMADRMIDGSVHPFDNDSYTLSQDQAELVARLSVELESTGWKPVEE